MTTDTTRGTADPQLAAMVDDLLDDLSGPDVVREVERDGRLPDRLVAAFTAAELHRVGIAEQAGGAGGSTADAAAVITAAGRHACPLPVAEQALLAGWLLAAAGLELPPGLLTTSARSGLALERSGAGWTVHGALERVPWAGSADHVTGLASGPDGTYVVLLPAGDLTVVAGRNLAGERRDRVTVAGTVDGGAVARVDPALAGRLEARGAVTRALLLAGASTSILSSAVRHAQERQQFGRSINRFQAVATHLARIAEESVVATAAADLGVRAFDTPDEQAQAQVAKVAAGEAATTAARLAHQVHGAMGVTAEFDLQLFTRRVWAWRDEYGGEARWARRLGERVLAGGSVGAWDVVCGVSS